MVEPLERSYETFVDLATGLYDRRTMWSRLAEEMARARRYHYPLSLMLLAFDESRPGEAMGQLLQLARLLTQHTRTADILARYSEDTLAILLPCTDEAGALQLAERIQCLAQTGAAPEGGALLRIGLTAALPDYAGDKLDLVEQVEWALREAKKKGSGKHRIVVPTTVQGL
jgi:diguanylate cyclase (GGDEF)-like protein